MSRIFSLATRVYIHTPMGKQKNKSSKNNNVFKVAGARSLKVKKKAKAVSSQLKKLAEGTRQKTAQVDGQLTQLHGKLLQGKLQGEEKETKMVVQESSQKPKQVVNPNPTMDKLGQLRM